MPEAASVALAGYLQNTATRDGGTIGLPFSAALIQLKGQKDANYDPSKFVYLGSSFSDVPARIASSVFRGTDTNAAKIRPWRPQLRIHVSLQQRKQVQFRRLNRKGGP